MPIHRFALYGAAAAAAVLIAAIGLAYVAGPRQPDIGDEPTPGLSATPELITTEQIEAISLYTGPGREGESNGLPALLGPSPGLILEGEQALVAILPSGEPEIDQSRLTGARYIEFSGPLNADPQTRASVTTYVALFETAEDADRAYDSLVGAHESPDGWNLRPMSTSEELGIERVQYAGQAYDRGEVTVYLWHERNAVLAAFAWDGTQTITLIEVARRMDGASHRTP